MAAPRSLRWLLPARRASVPQLRGAAAVPAHGAGGGSWLAVSLLALLCALLTMLAGPALAAPSLEAFSLSTAGISQLGAAGPPLSCSVFGPDPRTAWFGSSIVQAGVAVDGPVCGVPVVSQHQQGAAGTVQTAATYSGSFGTLADPRSFTGNAEARAQYGVLGARAAASYTGAVDSMTLDGSEAFARQVEVLTFGGASGPGTFRPTFTIDGSFFNVGRGDSDLSFHWQIDGGPVFMAFRLAHRSGFLSYYGPNGFVAGFPGMTTTGDATLGYTVSGQTQFTVSMPITFGTAHEVSFALWAGLVPSSSVGLAGPSAGGLEFYSSVRLTGIELLDGLGQPLAQFSVSGGSGTVYGPGGVVAVPEPPAAALLLLGLVALLIRRRLVPC